MNTNKSILKEKYIILISSFIAYISMFAIESFIAPSYLIKSSIKLVVFFLPIFFIKRYLDLYFDNSRTHACRIYF